MRKRVGLAVLQAALMLLVAGAIAALAGNGVAAENLFIPIIPTSFVGILMYG